MESRKAPKGVSESLCRASSPSSASRRPERSSARAAEVNSPTAMSAPAATPSSSPASVSWFGVTLARNNSRMIGRKSSGDHRRSSRESTMTSARLTARLPRPIPENQLQRLIFIYFHRRRFHIEGAGFGDDACPSGFHGGFRQANQVDDRAGAVRLVVALQLDRDLHR